MNANSWSPTWRTKSSGMSRSGPRVTSTAMPWTDDQTGYSASGLVYDVRTGLMETVVVPSRLGNAA